MNALTPRKTLCVLALLASPLAWAGNYTVGVEAADQLPVYKGDTGSYSGYSRELLDAFAARYGHTFTYKAYPAGRLLEEFGVARSVDFRYPDNPLWSTGAKKGLSIHYSQGLVPVTEGLLVPPERKGQKMAAVGKIAAVRGFTPVPYLEAIRSNKIEVAQVNSPEAGIGMAESGRVDGVYLSVLTANHVMESKLKKPGVVVFDSGLPNTVGDFALSTIAHPEVIAQLNEFLAKEKDLVARLKAKYGIAP